MDDDLYDEFGNYVGPELDDSGDEEEQDFDFENEEENGLGYENEGGADGQAMVLSDGGRNTSASMTRDENRIILHEDKKYYPDADEVYPGVRTVTLDEDAQDLTEPIIKPIRVKNFSVLEKEPPILNYSTEFLASLMNTPTLIRNVAIVGQLHHGKTLFVDSLVQATQEKAWDPAREMRYTDTRKDEQERELSIKSTSVSLVLENLKSKSYLVNILDCPGHVNFSDESTAALRSSDGCVIVVDAVEGVMLSTARLVKHAFFFYFLSLPCLEI
jgi:U5 small nuclear ribonucleoprotein component